jgi:hypothetical protein
VTVWVLIERGAEKNIINLALCFLIPWAIIFPLAALGWFCGGYVVVALRPENDEE